jgi:hypothetical protein
MKRIPGFHPGVPLFPLPIEGGGKGGIDMKMKFNDFLFHSPSPNPLPPGERDFPDRDPREVFSKQRTQRAPR